MGLKLKVVYKIPYRRARAWPVQPLGRVRRASKGILHTTIQYTLSSRALGLAAVQSLCRVRARAKVS